MLGKAEEMPMYGLAFVYDCSAFFLQEDDSARPMRAAENSLSLHRITLLCCKDGQAVRMGAVFISAQCNPTNAEKFY